MLLSNLATAFDVALYSLQKRYPVGTQVAFMIAVNQRVPSTGVVVGHDIKIYDSYGDIKVYEYLHVKHDQAKPSSRYSHRKVTIMDLVDRD